MGQNNVGLGEVDHHAVGVEEIRAFAFGAKAARQFGGTIARSWVFTTKATRVSWALLSSKAAGTAPDETAAGGTVMGLGVGMGKPRFYRMPLGCKALGQASHLGRKAGFCWFLSHLLFLYLKNSSSR
jgi:hypothetical protein